jgi:hypothetical protein
MPAFSRAFRNFTEAETLAQASRVAIACKIYRHKHGTYPPGLKDLAPEYIGEIPKDPFTGKDFVYRMIPEGGFVVYSVGPNGQDNGGKLLPLPGIQQVSPTKRKEFDDIGWREEPVE